MMCGTSRFEKAMVIIAVLLVIANVVPMLGLTVVGRQSFTTVFGGAVQLWNDHRELVAALVLFTAIVAPALQVGFMLAIVLGARREPRWVYLQSTDGFHLDVLNQLTEGLAVAAD